MDNQILTILKEMHEDIKDLKKGNQRILDNYDKIENKLKQTKGDK